MLVGLDVFKCFFGKKNWRFEKISLAFIAHIFPTLSRIQTEYGETLSIYSPNAEKCGKNSDQNNSKYGHFLRSALCAEICKTLNCCFS